MSTSIDSGRALRIFLIRHGETVDNVAGLYAGSRDSALTNHGMQQARRLGRYFANLDIRFRHIFSSDLSRAATTADCVRAAQQESFNSHDLKVVEARELREQDFGWLEGKSFHSKTIDAKGTSSLAQREGEFQDVESKTSLALRAQKFVNEHLLPAIQDSASAKEQHIAVVSHGMLLSALWRCILRRQLPRSVEVDPELLANRAPISLEHIGGWSNTGFLELEAHDVKNVSNVQHNQDTRSIVIAEQAPGIEDLPPESSMDQDLHTTSTQFSILVKTINAKPHLEGLKRAVNGSSKYDEGQTSIKNFFTKQPAA